MKNICFFLAFFISCNLSLYAQNARIYMSDDGLCSSRVKLIYQDKNGFVWIGGENGLNRVTGNHLQQFMHKKELPASVSDNDITELYMDSGKNFWVGTGKGLNRYSDDNGKFERVFLTPLDLPEHGVSVSSIVEDVSAKRLIVSTSGHGISVVNTDNFSTDSVYAKKITRLFETQYISKLLLDSRKWLWGTTSDHGFSVIDLRTMRKIRISAEASISGSFSSDFITGFKQDPRTGNMLISSSSKGIYIYDSKTRILRKPSDPILQTLNIQSFLIKKDGTILLGSENHGIWVMDRKTETIHPLAIHSSIVDLEHSKVHALMEDNTGNLWVGLYQKGVFIESKTNSGFDFQAVSRENNGKNSACVCGFSRDGAGRMWFATDGAGIFQSSNDAFNLVKEQNNGLTCNSMIAMATDRQGRIWAGSYGHGIFLSTGTGFSQPDYVKGLSNNKVMCLEYDPLRNYLYIGTNGGGFNILNLNTNKLIRVNANINKWVRALKTDKTGRLWIGTSEGTFYYDVDHYRILNVDIGQASDFPTNCFEEAGDCMYIGTSTGLIEYNMKSNHSTVVDLGKIIDSNNIMALALGRDESLWFTTPKCLSRINLRTRHIRTYNSFDGFHIGEFRYGSVFTDKNGTLLFGGDNGYIRVNPVQVNQQQYKMRPLYFTDLNINNNFIDFTSEETPGIRIDASLTNAQKIRLSYKNNSFTLYFAAQEYANPQKVNYSYRLSGYDNIWHHTDASNAKATYVSLPPGRYTLEIKGYFNEDSQDISTRSIRIVIANPWYSSLLAKFLYVILLIVVLYYSMKLYNSKQEQLRQLEMAKYNEQVKEDKLRLFTSIAHEIRTPLTLIISPLKKLMEVRQEQENDDLYSLMYRNSMRILKTVNQLLDIRKLDNGQLRMHFEETELISIIENSMQSFSNMATVKKISFSMESLESNHLNVWLDPLHFDKIIYNILSNAFKFTPVSGRILIRIACSNNHGQLQDPLIHEFVELRFFNTGPTIKEADLERIFERFYQGSLSGDSSGSGIGLHLTQELVHLHHGTVTAQNIGDEGVEFVVRIPLGNAHLNESELKPREKDHAGQSLSTEEEYCMADFVSDSDTGNEENESEPRNRQTILVVDDDEDFCKYLKKELSDFNVVISNSGNKAWKQILSLHPDVVVTDYLMPDGNGLELCSKIKSNPETDSIPVIVLTSENTEQVQMQSMQQHADRFLTKPLNILLLRGAIGQSLRVREKIRNKVHRTDMGYNYEAVAMDSADDKLVKRVIEYIREHLDNSDMSVEELSREVGFSRVHLNRKLKELLGMSPSNLIKSIRLKQAAYLLVNNKVNISEVAYKVGFSSHSYFSYNFHDFFGMSPKEFVIYYTENPDEESIRKLLE